MQNNSRQMVARKNVWLAASLCIAPLVLGTSTVYAQGPQAAPVAGERLVTLDVRDARLEQAIAALKMSGGLDNIVIVGGSSKGFAPITLSLSDQPLSRVLKAVAASAGAILTEEDGIYYLRARAEGDATPAVRPAPAQEVAAVAIPAPPKRKTSQYAKIKTNFILPSDIQRAFEDNKFGAFLLGAISLDEATGNVHPKSFGDIPLPITSPAGNPGNAPANAPNAPGGAVGSAGRDDSYSKAGQRGLGGFGGQGGNGGFGGQGGGLGGQGGGAGQNGAAANLVPDGINRIISNDADNALLIDYDDVEGLNRLREIIKILDVAPRQVLIRSEFISVSLNDADSFGIDWRFQPAGNLDVLTTPQSSGASTVVLAYATGNAVANLRASLTRSRSNILQAPIISTSNNRLAFINVSNTVTVPQTVVIPGLNGPSTTFTNQVPVTSQSGLSVTPHINGDNTISMLLAPQIQSPVTVTQNGGYFFSSQQLSTYRRVRNGETMVLGGFVTKQQTTDITKVPLLSDLPIIGNLFTQKSNTVQGTEILIFVTPTIIEDSAQGSVGIGGGGSPAPTP